MKLLSITLSVLLLLATMSVGSATSSPPLPPPPRYESIFSFGDFFTDTGNNPVAFAANSLPNPETQLPYGMTFFGHPTGRNSNGRLIIDFIDGPAYVGVCDAENLGLPFVPPFLAHNGSFRLGANFAVAGATTLNVSFFSDLPFVGKFVLNTTSSVQLQWFESLKPSLCSPAQECQGFFHKSLFFMGEFGVNDYSFSLFGKTLEQLKSLAPDVVKTIMAATEVVIKHGAKTVVVPGITPLGCSPPNLALFPSADPAAYENDTGCLKGFNELAAHHNSLLQESLREAQMKHPDVVLVYADFFTPIMEIVASPAKLGFTTDVLRCCCGGGGKYNFNMSAGCGMPGATVCENPSSYLFWDGHLTEAAYRHIAGGWLKSIADCKPW